MRVVNRHCNNCGVLGHIYKHCKEPITSYGIIAFYIDKTNQIRYLEVNRKHSLSFIEFIRGHYISSKLFINTQYVIYLFNNMTISERNMVNTLSFRELWHKWIPPSCTDYRDEYKTALHKYNLFRAGFKHNGVSLKTVLEQTSSVYTTPEWGFPKGRKHGNESFIQCALREFEEETSIDSSKLHIITNKPAIETYTGSNKKIYRNVYYIAGLISDDPRDYNRQTQTDIMHNSKLQSSEIRCVAWETIYNALDNIRDYHYTRKNLLKKINKYVASKYDTSTEISNPFHMPSIITPLFAV